MSLPRSFLEKASSAASVAANAKAAAQIAGKQAEHGKLTQLSLPSAYWRWARTSTWTGRFRDEFGNSSEMDGLLSKIQSLKQAHPGIRPPQIHDRARPLLVMLWIWRR